MSNSIAVIGANGHTGRFVVQELERRGLTAIRIVRDLARLEVEGEGAPPIVRVADIGDPASLDAGLSGAAAVINCAGPFLDTAGPVIDAALRAQIPYLDVTAEQAVAQTIFATRQEDGKAAGVAIIPAAAFFGGLGELLAAAATDGVGPPSEIAVAIGLDSWRPTLGTRLTGQRHSGPRLITEAGALRPIPVPAPQGQWDFPSPLGRRDVLMLSFSEMATLAHFGAAWVTSWINVEPINDIRDPSTLPQRLAIPAGGRRSSSSSTLKSFQTEIADGRRLSGAISITLPHRSLPRRWNVLSMESVTR